MRFDRRLVDEGTVLYNRSQEEGVIFDVARVTKVLKTQARATQFDPESGETGRSFRVTLKRGKEVGASEYESVYWRVIGTDQFGPQSLADVAARNERARQRRTWRAEEERKRAKERQLAAIEVLKDSEHQIVDGPLGLRVCTFTYQGVTSQMVYALTTIYERVRIAAIQFLPLKDEIVVRSSTACTGDSEHEALLVAIEKLIVGRME